VDTFSRNNPTAVTIISVSLLSIPVLAKEVGLFFREERYGRREKMPYQSRSHERAL